MKVFFDSVGCRLNQAEIEKLALDFRAVGYDITGSVAEADLVVINTCAVTAAASADSRQKVRQANRAGAQKIVVTGCWATLEPDKAMGFPGVSAVIQNNQKDHLTGAVLGEEIEPYDLEPLERNLLPGIHKRTRAFIKVQDGCDNCCTFCVTRLARGKSVSTPKEDVLKEVISAEKGKVKEIVLSGVHLASWGKDLPEEERINDLIAYLLKNSQVERIRLSSIEPWNLDDRFFDLWQDARLCPHFHLPLQSGSGDTLKRMARHNTPEQYHSLVESIRSRLPEAAITTDLIVGFPGETEATFGESLQFVREMEFAGGHVFKYSARAGTPAAKYPGRVNGTLARERSQAMRAVLAESEARYQQQYLGRTVNVLWESSSQLGQRGWKMHGLTENYLPVTAWGEGNLWNEINQVKITQIKSGTLAGEILEL
jgi:threonylcarbamoyladenosine tRNA methylthiotransferase MtaB